MAQMTHHAPHRTSAAVREFSPAEVEAHLLAQDATVLDVRTLEQVAEQGWIAGAVHVPADVLDAQADPSRGGHHPRLDPQQLTIVVPSDGGGARTNEAVETLMRLGYREVARLAGGFDAWEQAGYPVAGHAPWHPEVSSR